MAEAESIYTGQIIEDSKNDCSFFVPRLSSVTGTKMPVIVCLPGKNVRSKDDLKLWKKSAAENGFFVINMDVDYPSIQKETDLRRIQFRIDQTLKEVSKIYNLRADEIYIAGTSSGGAIALSLALRYPKEYLATGIISGSPMQFNASFYLINAEQRHFYIIHGDRDGSVPIQLAYETKQSLEDSGADVKFMKVSNGEHILPAFTYEAMVQWFAFQENIYQNSL